MSISIAENPSSNQSLVFIDSRISNLERVVAGLAEGTQWVLIDSDQDGLTQIAAALQGSSNLQSIQVLSHGGPGSLLLGSGSITSSTLQSQSALLASIGAALAPQGDLLLYGCNVAQGDAGAQFIALLAQLTGADVAASTDITGDAAQGGDWVLESKTGSIETTGIALSAQASEAIGTLAIYTGTAGNDSLIGGADADSVLGLAGIDTLDGSDGNDTVDGGDGADTLYGGTGNDSLIGGSGNDRFYGGDGGDTIDGGIQGSVPWTLVGGDYDILDYTNTAGVQVNFTTRTATVTGDPSIDSYSGIEEIQGGANTSDVITGRLSESVYDYAAGGSRLSLYLRGGSDTVSITGYGYQQPNADGTYVYYHWSTTGITVSYSNNVGSVSYGAAGTQVAGTDTLVNVGFIGDTKFNDLIDVSGQTTNHFGYFTDPYNERSWNFLFMGRGGSDTVIGNGSTALYYQTVTNTSTGLGANLNLATGSADLSHLSTSGTALGSVTFSGVSSLYGTNFSDTLTGSDSSGTQVFRGAGGNDFIDGKGGADRADYNWASEGLTFNLASGFVNSPSQGNDTLRGIEEIRTTRFDDTYDATGFLGGFTSTSGNVGSSWTAWNRYLDNGGNDLVIGNGSTQVDYGYSLVPIEINLGTGIVDARPGYTANAELYSTVGRDTLSGVYLVAGSAFDDLIIGGGAGQTTQNLAMEWFRGGAGRDTINGAGGRDIAYYSSSPNAITVDLRRHFDQVIDDGFGFSDTLLDIQGIGGSAFGDSVRGSDNPWQETSFYAGKGADSLDGGGSDMRISYFDDPSLTNDQRGVEIRLNGWVGASGGLSAGFTGSGRDGWGDIDQFVNVNDLSGSHYNDTIYGDSRGTRIDPRGGNDWVDAGGGVDTLEFYFARDDVHVNLADERVYNDGQGLGTAAHTDAIEQDTVIGFENVIGGIGNDSIVGNSANNLLQGEDGNDTIDGAAGNDTLEGGTGNDLLIGGTGNDTFNSDDGSDTLDGGVQSNVPWTLSNRDFDTLNYSGAAGTQINLSTRTVTVTGLTGIDSYSGIENINGGVNTTDVVTGRTSNTVADYATGGSNISLYLQGGSDTVSITGYGYQQLADGAYVYYHWSKTGINVSYSGNVGSVSYGASGSQLAGTDTLVNIGFIGDSKYNDFIDVSGLKTNQFGYLTDPLNDRSWNLLFMGRGGSDTVIGNGSTILNYSSGVTHTNNGQGVNISLVTGSADLSHLSYISSGVVSNLGTLTFSGVYSLFGTKFSDTLIGGLYDSFESFRPYGGNDFIDGGTGYDRADYNPATEGMTFNLASGIVSSASQGEDTLRGIEEIRTTQFDDVYNATGFVGGFTSTTANVGSYWWGLNAYIENGGNDLIIGNGSTRVDYGNSLVAIHADLAAGFVDARIEADKSTVLYQRLGRDTLSGVYEVRGSAFDDLLVGGGVGRTSTGGAVESFRGGAGNDTIDGVAGYDAVSYFNSPNAIVVDLTLASGQVQDGWGFVDTLLNIDEINGSDLNDSIKGSSANESFAGRKGNDSVDGGTGTDEIGFWNSDAGVRVLLSGWVGSSGAITAGFTGSATDGFGTIDVFRNIEGIEGSGFDDTLIGDAGNNVIDGRGGNDSLDGGLGTDTLEFNQALIGVRVDLAAGRVYDDGQGVGDAVQSAAVEIDTITGFENVIGGYGHDSIIGDAGANWLRGEAGSDTILGGAGNDTLDGGTPIDLTGYTDGNVVSYSTSTAAVNVNLQTGTASDGFGGADTLSNFFRVWGSAHNDVLTGSNAITFEMFRGGAGNDTIDGGAKSVNPLDDVRITGSADGAVVLNRSGGNGSNRVEYTDASAAVTVDLQAGTASGGAGNDILLNINQARGSNYNDLLLGSDRTDFAEEFEGWSGNDTIDGRGGFDRVQFRWGTTGAVADLAAGRAWNDGFNGTDTLIGIEGLVGSTFDDQLIGDQQDNSLSGLDGDDLLLGGDGADTLTGGRGDDTLNGGTQRLATDANFSSGFDFASYADATSGVTIRLGATGFSGLATGADQGTDVLIDIEYVAGSAYNDSISGTNRTGAEIFRGGEGDDTLVGGDPSGTDLGFNMVDYRRASGAVQANLATGAASGADGNDVLIGMQGILGSLYNDSLVGNAADNFFTGRAGNDTIDGGDGNDRVGYNLASSGVVINLAAGTATGGEDTDTLISIENLRGSEFNDTITGSSVANNIEARAGNDSVSGGAGNDSMHGGFGNDTLRGEAGNDALDGGDGSDIAGFTGNRINYTITANIDGSISVADTRNSTVAGFDGTDTLRNFEALRFADGDLPLPIEPAGVGLSGIAYHWKSHMLLSSMDVSVRSKEAGESNGPPAVLDLRAGSVSTEAGTGNRIVTVQVWGNAQAGDANFDFRVTSSGTLSASFTSSLGGSWTVLGNTDAPNEIAIAGFDSGAGLASGPVQLGTLSLTFAPSATRTDVAFSQIGLGEVFGPDLSFVMANAAPDSNGQWSISNLPAGPYSLTASRANTDTGNAITSADALAALRLAVNINPNPDPDGAGPLSALRVSPYQFIAADVNGSNTVTSADALAILRMAVKLPTALPNEWFFVEESRDFWNEGTNSFTLTRTNTAWDRNISVDPSIASTVNLVGVLKGDVNGSWAAPAGSVDLDALNPTYFSTLASTLGVPTDQWGV